MQSDIGQESPFLTYPLTFCASGGNPIRMS